MQKDDYQAKLLKTIKQLLSEDGCPWDKKQNNASIIQYLKNESEELAQALANEDYENICEELGDVLFIIILTAVHNEKLGKFNLDDVLRTIDEKLIRRHPHVFAGSKYESEEELVKQWNEIKAQEKATKSRT